MEDTSGKDQVRGEKRNPGRTAADIALHRLNESGLPEEERICYNPYAVLLLNLTCFSGVFTSGWSNVIRA